MRKKTGILFLALICSAKFFAQSNRCSSNEYLKAEEEKKSHVKSRHEMCRQQVRNFLSLNQVDKISQSTVIPVVVHVLYNNADQNIPDSKIHEQIDVLNNDYSRSNQDAASTPSVFQSVSENTDIQFCLAKRDPNGKPTTGIERRYTTVTAFSIGDDMKDYASGGLDAWPADDYLNLWICNFQGSLLGFATFPGSPPATDGVVIYYAAIGGPDHVGKSTAYNLGRTATHEIGHWLGLFHIWGDDGGACTGSDNIDDTPNQAKEHFGNPVFPQVSCGNDPDGDMFMNYLDYSDDFSMNMFTAGQADEMKAVLQTSRNTIATSMGCVAPAALLLDASVAIEAPDGIVCISDVSPIIILKNVGTSTLTTAKIKYGIDDDTAQTYNWAGVLTSGATDTIPINLLTAVDGIHNFIVQCTLTNGVVEVNTSNNIAVTEFTTATFAFSLPIEQDFEDKLFPSQGWRIINNDNGTTWMRTSLAASGGKASLWINGASGTIDGTIDDLSVMPVYISGVKEPILAFDVAYQFDDAQTSTHTLQVLASTDCGKTFKAVYEKSNEALKTVTGSQNPFIPTAASQWRKDTLSLKNFTSTSGVLIVFRNIAGNSNGLYIDNIKIGSVNDIFPDAENINFTVLPNPSNGLLNFTLHLLESSSAKLRIFNSIGQKVFEREYDTPSATDVLDLRTLRSGVYSVQVIADGEKKSTKIIIF